MLRMVEENPALSTHFINYLVMRNRRIEQDLIGYAPAIAKSPRSLFSLN